MKTTLALLICAVLLSVVGLTAYGQKEHPSGVALSLHLPVTGLETDRVVDWHPVHIMTETKVLEIVDVKVAGESITIGQPFAADDDWLETLTFRVRNVSGKTITLFGFGIAFPELSASSVGAPGFSISFNAETARRDAGAPKPLMANEEVDLKLPPDQLAGMRRASAQMIGTRNLSRVNITVGLANFEDGTKTAGFSLRRQASK